MHVLMQGGRTQERARQAATPSKRSRRRQLAARRLAAKHHRVFSALPSRRAAAAAAAAVGLVTGLAVALTLLTISVLASSSRRSSSSISCRQTVNSRESSGAAAEGAPGWRSCRAGARRGPRCSPAHPALRPATRGQPPRRSRAPPASQPQRPQALASTTAAAMPEEVRSMRATSSVACAACSASLMGRALKSVHSRRAQPACTAGEQYALCGLHQRSGIQAGSQWQVGHLTWRRTAATASAAS